MSDENKNPNTLGFVFKWSVVGILGMLAIGAVLIGVLAYNFSPIIKVDEKQGIVQLLGGLIDIKQDGENYSGSYQLTKIEKLNLKFKSGNLELNEANKSGELSWNCKDSDNKDNFKVDVSDGSAKIDLTKLSKLDCNLSIPTAIRNVKIKGANGKIDISEPDYNLDLSLNNGMVELSPKKNKKYNYDNVVGNGVIDQFEHTKEGAELNIKISLNNGMIKKVAN